jgi:hypothetical protein
MTRICEKLDEIEKNIEKNNSLSDHVKGRARLLIDCAYTMAMPSVLFPIGTCHGDFTLSNMLLTDRGIFLIDFLDTWIESPVLDISKLNQEAQLMWSCRMAEKTDSEVKFGQNFSFIYDRLIEKLLLDFPKLSDSLLLSHVMNNLRLLQYEKSEEWALRILKSTEAEL